MNELYRHLLYGKVNVRGRLRDQVVVGVWWDAILDRTSFGTPYHTALHVPRSTH
jgi:hypothetical protein